MERKNVRENMRQAVHKMVWDELALVLMSKIDTDMWNVVVRSSDAIWNNVRRDVLINGREVMQVNMKKDGAA